MLYVAVLYSFDSHPKSHSISEKPFSLNLLFYRLENGPIKTISRKIHNSQNYLLESKGEETLNQFNWWFDARLLVKIKTTGYSGFWTRNDTEKLSFLISDVGILG